MTTQTTLPQQTAITPVSETTKTLVDQKLIGESDEIKQKMGELVDLIKQRAEAELQSTENMTREAYVQAMNKVQATLKKTETFFQEQERTVDRSIRELNDDANRKWEAFVADLKTMGDRVDRAVNAAWKELNLSSSDTNNS